MEWCHLLTPIGALPLRATMPMTGWCATARMRTPVCPRPDTESMTSLAELRDARAPHAVPTAVWSALLPIGAVAYVAWKVFERGRETVYTSEFDNWLTIVGTVMVCAAVVGLCFWRTTRTRVAFVIGICLAAVACYAGLVVEMVANGS